MTEDLPSSEYRAARTRLESLGAAIENVQQILQLLAELPAQRAAHRDEYVVLAQDGPITWVNHESLAWSLGESIRQALSRRRTLRADPVLWSALEAVATDPAVGKGREPFVMLLGQYGGPDRASVLFRLLDDREVVGHALYALRLLGVSGAEQRARELERSQRAWIRKEARRYLEKVAPPA